MQDELKGMRRVLRKLGHLSEDGVIQNKGRVACEVSTADELLTTEVRSLLIIPHDAILCVVLTAVTEI